MSDPRVDLVLSAILGSSGLMIQTTIPPVDPGQWYRDFGVIGLVMSSAYFMLRYFMNKSDKKDEVIQAIMEKMDLRHDGNAKALIAHIERGYAVQMQTIDAVNKLTSAIERSHSQGDRS